MSQQRVHVPDASLPSPGSARAFVPPLRRYYQGTATSCRPSRRVSFPSLGGTTGSRIFRSRRRCVRQRRAWGWSPGIPFREFFRGDDRISQVPGEPPFPFAHGLRPRPADASLTVDGTLAWPPLTERRRRRRQNDFRGSIAWLSGSPPTYHALVSRRRARLASRCWSGSPGRAFTRRVPIKGFQLTSCGLSSFSKLLGTITFSLSPNGMNSVLLGFLAWDLRLVGFVLEGTQAGRAGLSAFPANVLFNFLSQAEIQHNVKNLCGHCPHKPRHPCKPN